VVILVFRCPASLILFLIMASAASGAIFVVDDDGAGNFTSFGQRAFHIILGGLATDICSFEHQFPVIRSKEGVGPLMPGKSMKDMIKHRVRQS